MAETEPQDWLTPTRDGIPIVYIVQEEASVRILSPQLGLDYSISRPCFSEKPAKNSIAALAPCEVVFNDEIVDPRPSETQDGRLIVYVHEKQGSIKAECPGFPFTFEPDRCEGNFEEEIAGKIKLASEHILKKSEKRIYPAETLEHAKRIVDSNGALPLVFVQNFDVSQGNS